MWLTVCTHSPFLFLFAPFQPCCGECLSLCPSSCWKGVISAVVLSIYHHFIFCFGNITTHRSKWSITAILILIVNPSRALGTGCDLHLWEKASFSPSLWWPDGGRDLQANDAEKLLSMRHEWSGQVWLDCRPLEESMQEHCSLLPPFWIFWL